MVSDGEPILFRGGCGRITDDWIAMGAEENEFNGGKIVIPPAQRHYKDYPYPFKCGTYDRRYWWYMCRNCATEAGWIW